jgi:hypothetical protein
LISKTNSSISKLNICLLAKKILSKTTLGVASLTGLVELIAYCIYADYQRISSDPLFKHKLKEKRIKEKLDQKTIETESETQTDFPDPENPNEVQSLCAQQFPISEQLIRKEGVQHLYYGLVVCYEPQNYFQNYKRILSERDLKSNILYNLKKFFFCLIEFKNILNKIFLLKCV